MTNNYPAQSIAIVGVAFRFPGDIKNEQEFWQALVAGQDLVTEIDPSRWATDVLSHPKRGEAGRSVTFSAGVLSRIDEFDASFFGISPREAAWLDPQQRLLLELAWESMENGGIPPSRLAGTDCAVYVGISGLDYGIRALDDLASFSAHTMTGSTLSIAANRLSYVFDLHGPSMSIDTACSSSLVALHQACSTLRAGDASMAMVGGVNVLMHPYPFVGFSKASMLSSRGRCHTFDASGDGYVRAEGGAVLLLKTLEQAQADGDRIRAVILASGVNADGGRKSGLTIPSKDGQVELMRSVLARAGVAADEVDYLEAHGTGTAIGDPIETSAIGEVYGQARSSFHPLPIGSVKTNLGHLEPASGMAGLVKALLILKHQIVPPSIHLATPNPKIDFVKWNLRTVGTPVPLVGQAGREGIVGVNSFGFGGANAHVLLQGYVSLPDPIAASGSSSLPPLVLSARSDQALRDLAGRYAELLEASPGGQSYYDIAYAAAYQRERLDKRLITLPASVESLREHLRRFSYGDCANEVFVQDAPRDPGKLAFVYAGNGAQWLGMGQILLAESDTFLRVVKDIDRKVRSLTGFSVIEELMAEDAASRMDDTEVAQPLLFALQVALTTMLREEGIVADAVAGHSVGEVAAAWAAGALTLDEAVFVICKRIAAQALTRGAGRMAAVSLAETEMKELLADEKWPSVEIAGINSPNNLTLSGPLDQLEALSIFIRERGTAFRMLELDYAFHSRCMDPVKEMLAAALDGFAPPNPLTAIFVSTVTGDVFSEALDASYWWKNVRQPVLFEQAIGRMIELGCRTFVEISPHAILLRYVKECLASSEINGIVMPSLRKTKDGIDAVQELGLRLHLLSEQDSLKSFFPESGRFVDLPSYPWQRERHWLPSTSEGYRLIERKRIHPLLGWPLKEGLASWENVLDPRTQSWLADHCVGGAVVLPGAAYIEMALAAALHCFPGDTQELEELDILSPLVFDGEHARSVRFDLNPRDGGFQIRSRQRLSDDEWVLNASGRLLGAVSGYVQQEFEQPEKNSTVVLGDLHYRLARALGLDYGPVFQGMQRASVGKGLLFGELSEAANSLTEGGGWSLHPGIVDVCFQSLLDFFQEEIDAGTALPLLPVKIGRLRLLRSAPVTSFRTRILRRGLRSVLADFELLTVDGEKVAVLSDCRFRAASLRRDKMLDPACWQIVPIVQPGMLASANTLLPSVGELSKEIKNWLIDQENKLQRAAYFGEAQPLFDALVMAFALESMRTLMTECEADAQSWLTCGDIDNSERQQLLTWVRDLLIEQSYLLNGENGWLLAESDMPSADEIWRTLLTEYPDCIPELILIGRKGRALSGLLAGRLDPTVFAAELRRSHQFETVYDESLSYIGTRVAIEKILDTLLTVRPASRRLRILEVSAGLSEIPRRLAHKVDSNAIDYVLAHVAQDACDYLRHEYQDESWVSVVDLEASDPVLKANFPLPSSFDVVIFRHVLSTASDRSALLTWAHNSLAAGGLFILAERYTDLASDLLFGRQCFLSPRIWESELSALGFDEVETCVEPAGESSLAGGYLVMGKKRREEVTLESKMESERWLLLAVDNDSLLLADQLQAVMTARGHVAISVNGSGVLDEAEQIRSLMALQKVHLGGGIDKVLLLAGSRGEDDIQLPVQGLNLVQELSSWECLPKLIMVTKGAISVNSLAVPHDLNPAHTALWGFGRVVMNEYPGLDCRLIDMPVCCTADVTEMLSEELLCQDGESEIVLRPGSRHVLRMQRTKLSSDIAEEDYKQQRYHLDFRVPGQLRNLLWLDSQIKELGPDQVEVRPMATGLNFRDVMYVMGLLPDEAVEHGFAGASLGLEFSGVVTRVGIKVDEYAPGDAVMGFGSACFASHVVTRANALTKKPENWSYEAAATVPTVFFTVYYALRQLANLQPGERVLIHGGAGGVGIAAIQLARHLGAEVFATAGSQEKRQFVELLGADRVFDSRSLDYAENILAETGGEGVDVVLNSLAGEAIRRNLQVLRPFGRFLELGKRDFFENTPIGLRPFKDNISYFGIDADQLLISRPDLAARIFREVMALFHSRVLSPLPLRAFPAERIVDAFRYMQQARQIGKVVVTFEGARIHPEQPIAALPSVNFSSSGAYLVTGGLSGFGLETARWLARAGAAQIILLSRRGMETPDAESAITSIEEEGARVVVLTCDVTNRDALQSALSCPELLPIKGVFHAAMVIDDALMTNLDPDRMRRVLAPKIKGGWNLHELTCQLPLDHFVLYSSVTTYIGNPGQANYVAGNAWFEGLAELRRAAGLPVTCIGWGPIGDAGYLTRNLAVKDSLSNRLGAEPLNSKMALNMLGRALVLPTPNISIGDFQFSSLLRLLPSAQGPRFISMRRFADDLGFGTDSLDDFRVQIEGKTEFEVLSMVASLVTQEVAQILAISVERIDPSRSLHDLGLDSLMGVELALGLEKRFGIQVSAMMLNEGPTVERVTQRIMERLFADDKADGTDLAATAKNVIAQHGDVISQEMMDSVITEIEKEQGKK